LALFTTFLVKTGFKKLTRQYYHKSRNTCYKANRLHGADIQVVARYKNRLSLDFLVSTPAFIIDLGTGRTTDTALYDQRPNVPRCCSKNLEQFAIRSDVIMLSAIIQD